MRLLSFVRAGRPSWGTVADGGIVDLGKRSGGRFPDLKSFLAAGQPQDLLSGALIPELAVDSVILAPVIPNPDKIVMVSVNYHDDRTDPAKIPPYPVLFLRLPSSQIAHDAPLIQPRSSRQLDYEGELAVIIGTAGRHGSVAQIW